MIKPFFTDFFTRAVSHRLFDVVARSVGVERIKPDKNAVFILRLELRLTVDRPGQIPVVHAVLNGNDSARGNSARSRVSVADVFDTFDDFVVRRFDGRAHPVGFVRVVAII